MDSNIRIRSGIQSELSYFDKYVKIDTSRTAYFANEVQSIVIEEDIKVVEYDKESGKPIKETNAKRKTTQDTNKAASKKDQNRVEIYSEDSLKHFADVSKKIETETQTVTKSNGLEFWKWLGIVIGLFVVIGFVVILNKSKR